MGEFIKKDYVLFVVVLAASALSIFIATNVYRRDAERVSRSGSAAERKLASQLLRFHGEVARVFCTPVNDSVRCVARMGRGSVYFQCEADEASLCVPVSLHGEAP